MSTASPDTPVLSAAALLGGESVLHARPRVVMDWIPLLQQGLPAAAADSVVRLTRIAQSELARALAIPERTLARRKREGARLYSAGIRNAARSFRHPDPMPPS